jgi:hypothetical protein
MPADPGWGGRAEASTAYGGEVARIRPERYADVLPPVRYPPAEAPPPEAVRPPPGEAADRSRWGARPHRLLKMGMLAIGCSLAAMLPVAGTVFVLAVITLLRAGDRAYGGLAIRRSARGARPTDPLRLVLMTPWALVRSLLVTLVVLPLGALAAAIGTVVVSLWQGGSSPTTAGGYAAAIFVAIAGLGPGSGGARRQLNRMFNATTRGPMSSALTVVSVVALTVAAIAGALTQFPVYWPAPSPGGLVHLFHLPSTGSLLHGLLGQLGRGTGTSHAGRGLPRL